MLFRCYPSRPKSEARAQGRIGSLLGTNPVVCVIVNDRKSLWQSNPSLTEWSNYRVILYVTEGAIEMGTDVASTIPYPRVSVASRESSCVAGIGIPYWDRHQGFGIAMTSLEVPV